jgi:choline dehydrogenase
MSGVAPFSNHLPVRIRFGEGVAADLTAILRGHGAARPLVMLDAELEERNAVAARAVAGLDVAVERFVKPPGEPTLAIADEAAAALRAADADAVVAIGGGSVIDTAKAARLSVQLRCRIADVLGGDRAFPDPAIPLVAVPTTAGTGSEVSGGAVITDPADDRKRGIASPALRAQDALVDPLLTHSMPPATTAYTGVDALAQAIAGMVARSRTPIGDAIALEAIRLIRRALVAAYRHGDDAAARSEMACASLMAGLTMNISDCAMEHALGQAISGLFHVPHGLTVGVVLAETLERERRHVPGQLERVADALGVPDDGSGDGSRAVTGVRQLLTELEFPLLRSIGVGEAHFDRLTELALGDVFQSLAPQPWTAHEVRDAYAAALAIEDRAPAAAARS